jgi:predicted metal-dependent peptidase
MKALPPKAIKARLQLMLQFPFLAAAVVRLPVVNAGAMSWCRTMATDGYFIYVNPAFCEKLSEADLQFVFAHEVLHCLLGHIDRRKSKDRGLWNRAIDYATNALLVKTGFEMPELGLYSQAYGLLTAEEIYECLCEERQEAEAEPENSQSTAPSDSAAGRARALGGFDDHIEQTDPEGVEVRTGAYPTTEARKQLRSVLAIQMTGQVPGALAGAWESEIEAATKQQVSWEHVLARFVSGLRCSDYRMFPFNKKHLYREIYLPSVGVPGPEHLVIAVDTSGSMSDDILSRILAEIDGLRAVTECSLTVIQCDEKIQKVETFDAFETPALHRTVSFRGRGGTDLRAAFDWIETQRKDTRMAIDALIYMTDGYGPTPETSPDYPVLWVMPKGGNRKPGFGQVIEISKAG